MNGSHDHLIDRFGATASSLCALHCAVCALLPAAFTAVGLGALLSHEAETGLALVAVTFGLLALWLARKTHGSTRVTVLLFMGIIGLVGARGLELSSSHESHGHEEEVVHHEDHHEDHHDDHDAIADGDAHQHGDEDEALHLAGSSIGVTGGLLLFVGHLLNLRAVGRYREECCVEPTEQA